MQKNKPDTGLAPEDPANQDMPPEKVGLKGNPKAEKANMEQRWKKVQSVFDEAQAAYVQGSNFSDVMASLIATLQNLAESEAQQPMGGLGLTGRPEMDLPPEPPAEQQ